MGTIAASRLLIFEMMLLFSHSPGKFENFTETMFGAIEFYYGRLIHVRNIRKNFLFKI